MNRAHTVYEKNGAKKFGWCSWLSHPPDTREVPSSSLGSNSFFESIFGSVYFVENLGVYKNFTHYYCR